MKLVASFAIALLVSCTSAKDVVDEQHLDCRPGQDIEILAGLDGRNPNMDGTDDELEVIVEVANNSHEEVTVKTIRVEQVSDDLNDDSSSHVTGTGYGKFNQVIPEGKDHTFELRIRSRARTNPMATVTRRQSGLELAVNVVLTNGDSYLCRFDVAVSR